LTGLGDGVLARSLIESELASTREAVLALEKDLSETDEQLSHALVIRRHVARTPERFAAHEREDVFERSERLAAKKAEIATWLKAAQERIAFLDQMLRSLAAERARFEQELAEVRRGTEQARAEARQATEQARAEARQATEQARAEAQLRVTEAQSEAAAAIAEAEARAQALPSIGGIPGALPALEIHQAVEAERLRIARDLHDGPAQVLSNLVLEAEIIERLLKRDPDLVIAELQEFRNSIKNAVADVRRFMFDLRPDSLDDLGLIATLRRLTTEWQQHTGVVCRLNIMGDERRLPPPIEEALFRIIQEALNNVRHHAQARTVEVNLDVRPDRVGLRVRDDGKGFDPSRAPEPGARRQLGVVGMRERAAAVGGRLEVRSREGSGTEIEGDFPLAN
jgi:two-component system sensor histidine kinase DegS